MNEKVLIVDDSAFNGEFLTDILAERFECVCVGNGKDALEYMSQHIDELSLLLLDIVMPEMDGFDVLAVMNKNGWINKIPVVMVSSEVSSAYINHAYDMGALDYLSAPFEADAIFRRIDNAFKKFSEVHVLGHKEENQMLEVLSNLVEFRNGETGLHLLHLKVITSILLKRYRVLDPSAELSDSFIELVSNASALHDLGKVAIPYEILNKPGKLTPEEFEIVKKHSLYGANMIEESPNYQDSEVLQVAYRIARWHHEKIDGRGYPDGLIGDEIPVYVQAVSIADCYDALTTERCYKKAFEPNEAISMIAAGECGAFSEKMVNCLLDSKEELIALLDVRSPASFRSELGSEFVSEKIAGVNSYFDSGIKTQLAIDRLKNKYLYNGLNECVFEYVPEGGSLFFARLNLSPVTEYSEELTASLKSQITGFMKNPKPVEGKYSVDIELEINGNRYKYHMSARLVGKDTNSHYVGKLRKI